MLHSFSLTMVCVVTCYRAGVSHAHFDSWCTEENRSSLVLLEHAATNYVVAHEKIRALTGAMITKGTIEC